MKYIKNILPVVCIIILGGTIACQNNVSKSGSSKASVINNDYTELSDTISETILPVLKPVSNVYIENSGSMDGYVKNSTHFEQTIYNFLGDLKILNISDTLNLNYINSNILPQGGNISDFTENLEPAKFRLRGGNRGISDLSDIIKDVLTESSINSISILVSDFIFSPGRNKNAEEYLVNQQIGIKQNWAAILKERNISLCILKLQSKFEGYYYNKSDYKEYITEDRPYYIWIIGSIEHITNIRNKIPDGNFKGGGVINSLTFSPQKHINNYNISANSGNYQRSKRSRHEIINIKKQQNGKYEGLFTFGLSAGLSDFKSVLGDSYLHNPDNYVITQDNIAMSNYTIDIAEPNSSGNNMTNFKFSTLQRPYGEIKVSLKRKVPKWVYESTDNSGVEAIAGKTYGLKYQVDGVDEAYTALGHDNYFNMQLTIK